MTVYTIDEIKKIVAPIAEEYGIEQVYIFGSYARGNASADSDLDFLIKGWDCKKPWAYPGMFVDFEEKFGKKVDIVSAETVNKLPNNDLLNRKFKYNLKTERILVYENE